MRDAVDAGRDLVAHLDIAVAGLRRVGGDAEGDEPAVLDQRQQFARDVGADRLETALGVGEAHPQSGVQQQVVAAGDELALHPAHDPAVLVEPGADRHIGVAGHQGRHERPQGVEVGRQVDVHVDQHAGVGLGPDPAQGSPAALRVEVHHAHAVERDVARFHRRTPPPVGTLVVGQGDGPPASQRVAHHHHLHLRQRTQRMGATSQRVGREASLAHGVDGALIGHHRPGLVRSRSRGRGAATVGAART